MGSRVSRGMEDLTIWKPPLWPSEHTDPETGRILAYQTSGRYQNPWMIDRPSVPSFFWDWFFGPDETRIPSQSALDETLPVKRPVWTSDNFTAKDSRMTWLGHATVLVELEGHSILTDPVFSSRASVVQFAGPKRYREAACKVRELPPLTAVLVSHNHYDHLDIGSVKELVSLQPNLTWFVPEGLGQWMKDNTGAVKVKEMTWWEEVKLDGTNFTVAFTPANHWCKRFINDDNKVLWGSWAVLGQSKRFWFGGDTGYCEVFKQIGEKYGPFDMAAIPIGAYQPNWFMKYQHVHPGEAVEIHKDIRCNKSLGIHWGTFKLTTEFYLEPPSLLSMFLNKSGLESGDFVTTDIGGSIDC